MSECPRATRRTGGVTVPAADPALSGALSGFLAGYAGVCLAFATERMSTSTFDASFSFLVISMVFVYRSFYGMRIVREGK